MLLWHGQKPPNSAVQARAGMQRSVLMLSIERESEWRLLISLRLFYIGSASRSSGCSTSFTHAEYRW